MTLSQEAIEGWDRRMDNQVEEARKFTSPLVVEEIRKFVEEVERRNPGLHKHSHRLTMEALHPKTGE